MFATTGRSPSNLTPSNLTPSSWQSCSTSRDRRTQTLSGGRVASCGILTRWRTFGTIAALTGRVLRGHSGVALEEGAMIPPEQPAPPAWSPPPGWYPYAGPSRAANGRPLMIAGMVLLGAGAVLTGTCWKLAEVVSCPGGCSPTQQPAVSEVLWLSGVFAGLLFLLSGLITTLVGVYSSRAGQLRHDRRYWDGHAWTPQVDSGLANLKLGRWLLIAGLLVGIFGAASFSTEFGHSELHRIWALLALAGALLVAPVLLVSGGTITTIAGVDRFLARSTRK